MPKTPAERAREYRARKKLMKPQKPPALTAAQRNRKYRARQKVLRNAVATIGENETPSTNFSGSRELPIVNLDNAQPSTSSYNGNILYNYLLQTSGQYGQQKKTMGDADAIVVQRPVVSTFINVNDIQVDPAQVIKSKTIEIECDLPATSVV